MRKPKMPSGTQFVTMTVEMPDESERDITVRFHVNPAERQTEFHPGYPAFAEFEGATFEDGSEVPEGIVDVEIAEEHLWEEITDRMEAMAERL